MWWHLRGGMACLVGGRGYANFYVLSVCYRFCLLTLAFLVCYFFEMRISRLFFWNLWWSSFLIDFCRVLLAIEAGRLNYKMILISEKSLAMSIQKKTEDILSVKHNSLSKLIMLSWYCAPKKLRTDPPIDVLCFFANNFQFWNRFLTHFHFKISFFLILSWLFFIYKCGLTLMVLNWVYTSILIA
jgi:hypothetical protein